MRRWKRDFELLGVLGSGFGGCFHGAPQARLAKCAKTRKVAGATLELGFGFASFNGENETWGEGIVMIAIKEAAQGSVRAVDDSSS